MHTRQEASVNIGRSPALEKSIKQQAAQRVAPATSCWQTSKTTLFQPFTIIKEYPTNEIFLSTG
jgi:hypothetical protein